MSWLKIKTPIFWSVIFSYWMEQEAVFRTDCGTKNGFYRTTGDNQLSGWTEKKLQSTSPSQTCTKKSSRSLFDGLLSIWSTIASWILAKQLCQRSMLSKLMRCQENCNACSQHWSTGRAQFISIITPDHTTNAANAGRTGLWSFASSSVFSWPLANQLPLLQASWQLFAGKTLPHSGGCRKCFPRVPLTPKHGFLCYKNKQTYFSLSKTCRLLWFLLWLIEMCLSLVVMI